MTRTHAETRELLRRYSFALGVQLYAEDVTVTSKRFRLNHRLATDDPIIPAMGKVYEAHIARVRGNGSPLECDRAVEAASA